MSELHRTAPQHGHGDRFLDLVLGVMAWCNRLDDLLAHDRSTEQPIDRASVDLMLGVIAVRTRLAPLLDAMPLVADEISPPDMAKDSLLR